MHQRFATCGHRGAMSLPPRFSLPMRILFLLVLLCQVLNAQSPYSVRVAHPRLLIENIRDVATRAAGPLADDYRVIKQRADAAVQRGGIANISNRWAVPDDLMNCGLAYLIERERGGDAQKYADVIIKQWGDGKIISNPDGSQFGYH